MSKIPTDLDEAVSNIIEMLSAKDKEYFKNTRDLCTYHHTLGRWIRNEWELWGNSGELKKWFISKGIFHADDMSSLILDATQAKLNNQDFDLEREIGVFKLYWAKLKENEEKSGNIEFYAYCGKIDGKVKIVDIKST